VILILMVVLPWLATEICWLVVSSKRTSARLVVYVICTVAILSIRSRSWRSDPFRGLRASTGPGAAR
jgi:amino acid transporter